MSQPTLNMRLTSQDATFLYFEKKEAPMHIGCVSIFEGEIPFDRFVENINSRMHLLPRYQQKIRSDPFNLSHPSWEVDPEFDIHNHVFRVRLEDPGSDEDLLKHAGRIFSPTLDRNKPLWDISLVYGLKSKRTAMILRVHHCMVDGVSGVDLLKIILDISPQVQPLPKPATAQSYPTRADATRRFFDALLGGMQERRDRWTEFQTGLLNLTKELASDQTRAAMPDMDQIPMLALPAPTLPFNRPCSGEHMLAWSTFSLKEARAIRAALDGTVNDVVLTVLSGAVSSYVEMHEQQTTGRNLRVMVPVSLRRKDQRGALGNLFSMLLVEIPLDLRDPRERFKYINGKIAAMNNARAVEGMSVFSALIGTLPASVQALVGALATTTPFPAFNMIATNVPGPRVTLYAVGKRMTACYPYLPAGYATGCACSVISYGNKLYFGLTADTQAMPDVERLKAFLDESFVELRKAAGVDKIKSRVPKAARGTKSGSD